MVWCSRSASSAVSDEVGSSMMMTRASRAIARMISTFCWSAMLSSPARARRVEIEAAYLDDCRKPPVLVAGKQAAALCSMPRKTFCATVSSGTSCSSWCIMAMPRASAVAASQARPSRRTPPARPTSANSSRRRSCRRSICRRRSRRRCRGSRPAGNRGRVAQHLDAGEGFADVDQADAGVLMTLIQATVSCRNGALFPLPRHAGRRRRTLALAASWLCSSGDSATA